MIYCGQFRKRTETAHNQNNNMQMTYDQLLDKLTTDITAALGKQQHWWLPQNYIHLALWIALALFAAVFLARCWFTVNEKRFRIVKRFGKYKATAYAGFHFKHPFFDRVTAEWTLEIMTREVKGGNYYTRQGIGGY